MNLRAEIFLACKYFKPKRNAVSVITLISVTGVALGVAVLIIVLAVMTGFTDLMKQKILDTTAHIQIDDIRRGYIKKPRKIIEKIKECGASSAAPIVRYQGLVQKNKQFVPKIIIGIDPEESAGNIKVADMIDIGEYSLEKNEILISTTVAHELMVSVGDKILVHAPNKLSEMVKVQKNGKVEFDRKAEVYLPHEFVITGLFSFGKHDFDKMVLFVNLDDADELFGLPWGAATDIYVWVEDPFSLDPVLGKIQTAMYDFGLRTLSWRQLKQRLLGVLVVEKNMMFFLLIFIVLVAAFSITNTLITVVINKTREIGLLKALGASSNSIMRIFLLQGFFVGLLGTIFGMFLGILVVKFRNHIMRTVGSITGMELFPKELYFFNELPAAIVTNDLLVIGLMAMILCTAGGIIPAWRAARMVPAEALRYE